MSPRRQLLLGVLTLTVLTLTPWLGARAQAPIPPILTPLFTEANTGSVAFTEPANAPTQFQMTFSVTNKTGFDLLLDYAIATISRPADVTDNVQFSGAGGANGLASAPLFIPNNTTGNYVYNLQTSVAPVPDNVDFGSDRVDFQIEMSRFAGQNIPNPNNISSAIGHLAFLDLTPAGTVPDPAVLNTLLGNQIPAQNVSLYPTLTTYIAASNPTTPGSQFSPFALVVDVPEPSAFALFLIAGGVLIGGYSRRRLRPAG